MSLFIFQETNLPDLVIEQVLKSNIEVLSANGISSQTHTCVHVTFTIAPCKLQFASWDTGKKSTNGAPLANSKHTRFTETLELHVLEKVYCV